MRRKLSNGNIKNGVVFLLVAMECCCGVPCPWKRTTRGTQLRGTPSAGHWWGFLTGPGFSLFQASSSSCIPETSQNASETLEGSSLKWHPMDSWCWCSALGQSKAGSQMGCGNQAPCNCHPMPVFLVTIFITRPATVLRFTHSCRRKPDYCFLIIAFLGWKSLGNKQANRIVSERQFQGKTIKPGLFWAESQPRKILRGHKPLWRSLTTVKQNWKNAALSAVKLP